MTKRKVLCAYDRITVHSPSGGKSMTEQHHEKSCNINNIMAKYQKTGLVDHINRMEGKFADVVGADYKDAMDLVKAAETEFYELPSEVRKRLRNDVSLYLDMIQTDDGVLELSEILNPTPEMPEEPAETAPPEPQGEQDEPVT